jgi:hypothetical protein
MIVLSIVLGIASVVLAGVTVYLLTPRRRRGGSL